MSEKLYKVTLTLDERNALDEVLTSSLRSEREKKRAQVLLLSDTSLPHESGGSQTDREIAKRLQCRPLMVHQVRERACKHGVLHVVFASTRKQGRARNPRESLETLLMAVLASPPPAGKPSWSLSLIRARLIELGVVEDIGLETIRTTLLKLNASTLTGSL
jgi:hypothetical protein